MLKNRFQEQRVQKVASKYDKLVSIVLIHNVKIYVSLERRCDSDLHFNQMG